MDRWPWRMLGRSPRRLIQGPWWWLWDLQPRTVLNDEKTEGETERAKEVVEGKHWTSTPSGVRPLKDEVMLRAMRPTSLPPTSTGAGAAGAEEPTVDLKEVLKAVMNQNSMLKRELADLKKKIDDSAKEKVDRQVKTEIPKPPSTTPPPSPPKGPPTLGRPRRWREQGHPDLQRSRSSRA